ncbi:MAG TPA: hypothetical protein VE218_14330 [Acidobacteriaceae bacterium]|nr:hypothetical protein [Acidobacteriaceae bacterium]
MCKSVRLWTVGSFGVLCFAASVARAAPADNGVVGVLQKKYLVTEMTPDHAQITKDGTTMVMKTAGVYSVPISTMVIMPDNKVVDGKVQAPNMFLRVTLTKVGAHVLQTGDKVYITKLDSKGDVLQFTIMTVDELDVQGQDAKKKYDANVSFHFKKGYLGEAPPEEVEQTIESVLAPDEGGDQGGGGNNDTAQQQQQPQQQAPPRPAPVQRVAAPAPPPAPPAAPAGPAPTITIGESSTEVLQAMGMPLQMIDLGKKKTFVYKNMKVIFVDDKVSDVQ